MCWYNQYTTVTATLEPIRVPLLFRLVGGCRGPFVYIHRPWNETRRHQTNSRFRTLCARLYHCLCTKHIPRKKEKMDKLMEPISIIGNALHIYMLAFSEPNSIRSQLMVYCKWLSSSALALNIINNSCRVFISQSGSQASYMKMTAQFDGCQVRARCLQRSDCVILVTAAFVTNLARSIPTSYLCHMSIRFHQSRSNELMGKCCPVPIKMATLHRPVGVGGSSAFINQKYHYWYQQNWLCVYLVSAQ